ncbi:Autophagy-related protein 11 [Fragilaria crotonensis]|nr:Autophagy-related protein 11 [Fragilaria crotonensis]
MASNNPQTRNIRVLSASTGACYNVALHPAELTVANIRRHLAAAMPPSDQILLLGPPYKVPKDAILQSEEMLNSLRLGDIEDDPSESNKELLSTTESTGAKRLFLFSKQALSQQAPDPPPCVLTPMDITLPTEAGPSVLQLGASQQHYSPLHQALEVYERRFRLHLDQGRVLADGADVRLAACRTCVAEQAVIARALRAAVSNLSVHFNGTQRLRSEFTADFQRKTSSHASLLSRFESLMTSLGSIQLHPSLVSVARASGRVMETLIDTVPVERERAWAAQCQISHQRLMTMFSELESGFAQLGTTASRKEEAKQDLESEEGIQALWGEVEGLGQQIRDRQAQRLEKLTSDHGEVVKVIRNAIAGDSAHSAFTVLEDMSKASVDVIPSMLEDDLALRQLMEKLAEAKTKTMKRMKVRLREVSVAQSGIQRVNSSVAVLKDAMTQQCENMVHLEHVAELPTAYRDFISEIRRRRAYGGAVTSSGAAMMERLASMREDEVKEREKFLPMVEMDTLPDIGPADNVGGSSSAASPMQGGVSSASSLTAISQHRPEESAIMATDTPSNEDLIVSADDQTDHELIVDSSGNATADAERKTLAYENAVLRQAIERMGTKSPRTYIDEAKDADPQLFELENLRKELDAAKAEARKVKAELAKKIEEAKASDKISHTSFSVGDFALFMPTGRGSGGKRTYLAFHTGCPHYYLSTDNINGSPDFVLGRIVFQEPLIAGDLGTDANPYGLHVGTKFFVNTVEVLSSP